MQDQHDTPGAIQDNAREYRGQGVNVGDILVRLPRGGTPLGEGGPCLGGTVLLGQAAGRGGRWLLEVVVVQRSRVLALTARFPDRESCLSFERKLEMRAGPYFGRLRDDRASGLLYLLLSDHLGSNVQRPVPSVTFDAVREVLEDYVTGHPLDEARLYGTAEPFKDAVACAEGWAWRRVMTFEGAMAVTMAALHPIAQDWMEEASVVDACMPVSAYYALLRHDGTRLKVGAVVEIPHPKSGYPPVVGGSMGRDPFARHAESIGLLSQAIGIELRPEHRLSMIPTDGVAGGV